MLIRPRDVQDAGKDGHQITVTLRRHKERHSCEVILQAHTPRVHFEEFGLAIFFFECDSHTPVRDTAVDAPAAFPCCTVRTWHNPLTAIMMCWDLPRLGCRRCVAYPVFDVCHFAKLKLVDGVVTVQVSYSSCLDASRNVSSLVCEGRLPTTLTMHLINVTEGRPASRMSRSKPYA